MSQRSRRSLFRPTLTAVPQHHDRAQGIQGGSIPEPRTPGDGVSTDINESNAIAAESATVALENCDIASPGARHNPAPHDRGGRRAFASAGDIGERDTRVPTKLGLSWAGSPPRADGRAGACLGAGPCRARRSCPSCDRPDVSGNLDERQRWRRPRDVRGLSRLRPSDCRLAGPDFDLARGRRRPRPVPRLG